MRSRNVTKRYAFVSHPVVAIRYGVGRKERITTMPALPLLPPPLGEKERASCVPRGERRRRRCGGAAAAAAAYLDGEAKTMCRVVC